MIPFDQLSAALENYNNRRRQPAAEPAPQGMGNKTPAAVPSVSAWGQESPDLDLNEEMSDS
jgi:hypothetical protein